MPEVKDVLGSQGSWDVRVYYTDGTSEMMPTAHKAFWRPGNPPRYERGGPDDVTWDKYRSLPRYPAHVALLKQAKRVVVTTDDFDPVTLAYRRTDYVGVYDIDDIKVDDAGMSYRFVNRLRWPR
jgi:hypothetical protein